MLHCFTTPKNFSNSRLDKFLAQQFPEFSRAHIQNLIREGKVTVNKRLVKPNYLLKENDIVEADITQPKKTETIPDPFIELDIVYEDKDIIIINKPAGLIVHPSATRGVKTLVNALLAYYPKIKNVGEDKLRPGIVHRLDKDTSGLMIIAKNNESFNYLKNLFKNKQVEKRYLALVKENLSKTEGKISLKISRSKSAPTKQATSATQGREALTYYKVVKRFEDYDLVDASPKTGRMHQIRVHFNAIGHPVAGDKKYGGKNQLKGLDRHFLHSYYLKFKLSNGEIKEFKIDLPKDLDAALKTLTGEDI